MCDKFDKKCYNVFMSKKAEVISIRVDKLTKEKAAKIFANRGTDVSSEIRSYLQRIVNRQGPAKVKKANCPPAHKRLKLGKKAWFAVLMQLASGRVW